ncbi:hypothetical protein D0962_37780 [Leptolyngbyaceae cyanobacterium CCMR0082]|uniref:Uncharacterized protein n=1 Tax=Adonisia turfae CCMR0082 TaxID=2304604 RepID=A0A6M0SJB8_9CYAN|nr:hypothetical protein [Adonisia turfae CCMR0082]
MVATHKAVTPLTGLVLCSGCRSLLEFIRLNFMGLVTSCELASNL